MKQILGRSADIIRSPSGRLIHGEFFTHLFYDVEGVERFQVRQTAVDRLVVSVVATEAFDEQARNRLSAKIAAHGDPGFHVAWRRVPRIEPGPSGKFRFTLSDLTRS